MKTERTNRSLLLAFLVVVAMIAIAANPSFTAFRTTQFATDNSSYVAIKDGATVTNTTLNGVTTNTGSYGQAGNGTFPGTNRFGTNSAMSMVVSNAMTLRGPVVTPWNDLGLTTNWDISTLPYFNKFTANSNALITLTNLVDGATFYVKLFGSNANVVTFSNTPICNFNFPGSLSITNSTNNLFDIYGFIVDGTNVDVIPPLQRYAK